MQGGAGATEPPHPRVRTGRRHDGEMRVKPSRETIAAIRFGYGLRPGEAPPADADALMAQLSAGPAFVPPFVAEADLLESFRGFEALRSDKSEVAGRQDALRTFRRQIRQGFARAQRDRAIAPIFSPYGFHERLAWFWSGHFAVAGKNLPASALAPRMEAEAIRPHLAGPFHLLLRAAATHPAMVVYLDQTNSIGPNSPAARGRGGLNENLAREIIELHTLGVGAGYTQQDVRQFAELLTGLTYDLATGRPDFVPRRAEPGQELILGRLYGGAGPDIRDVHAVLDDLAAHPATVKRLCAKLAAHFVADDPPESLVAAMEAAWRRSDGNLSEVYAAMLDHDESWSRFGEKVKQPFDFVASSWRAVGATAEEIEALHMGSRPRAFLANPFARLNHEPYNPPGPQGWPEAAEAWITPQGLSARIEWVSYLAREVAPRRDPRALLAEALPGVAGEATTFAVTNAAERWEGIALALVSPEFNRR